LKVHILVVNGTEPYNPSADVVKIQNSWSTLYRPKCLYQHSLNHKQKQSIFSYGEKKNIF